MQFRTGMVAAVAAAAFVSLSSSALAVTPGWECVPTTAGQAVTSGGTGTSPSCGSSSTPVLAPTYVSSGIGGKPTAEFSGANVQIVNGTGSETTTNSEGNLVIGYDPLPGTQTGSHNLVLGTSSQGYTSYGGIDAGVDNRISAPAASVLGGANNTASGVEATVSGGDTNGAKGAESSISGGFDSIAQGQESSVSGGTANTASAESSSITGGQYNQAADLDSTVTGGCDNVTGNAGLTFFPCGIGNETVLGGNNNIAKGDTSTVSGGVINSALGEYSAVSGGKGNQAKGISSAILGGLFNGLNGNCATSPPTGQSC